MIPKDAFISPDDPMVRDPFRDALISPDDPLVPREEERGVVVGMNGSTACEAVRPTGLLLDLDQVTAALEAMSEKLKENGIRGLVKDDLRRAQGLIADGFCCKGCGC